MNHLSITALLLGALSIAALHALIPSHWLAFALVGRAQRWPIRRTLIITALAGTGHSLLTVVLGMVLALVGKRLLSAIPPSVEHLATSLLLIALGVYFLISSWRQGEGCHHHAHGHHTHSDHLEGGESSEQEQNAGSGILPDRLRSRSTVMGALVLGMTLSPCLDLLAVYVAAASSSWLVLGAISLIMTVTTVVLMVLLVWLTLLGLQHLRLEWLERHEGKVVGVALVLLGLLLFFLK